MDPQTVSEFFSKRRLPSLDFYNFLMLFFWYERFEKFGTNRRMSPTQFRDLVEDRYFPSDLYRSIEYMEVAVPKKYIEKAFWYSRDIHKERKDPGDVRFRATKQDVISVKDLNKEERVFFHKKFEGGQSNGLAFLQENSDINPWTEL